MPESSYFRASLTALVKLWGMFRLFEGNLRLAFFYTPEIRYSVFRGHLTPSQLYANGGLG